MFGFSRGAYTARSQAGLVGLVGLIRKGDLDQMPRIWEHYRTPPAGRRVDYIDATLVGSSRYPEEWSADHHAQISEEGGYGALGQLPGNLR